MYLNHILNYTSALLSQRNINRVLDNDMEKVSADEHCPPASSNDNTSSCLTTDKLE